jgi:penicillin-binding protein 2
LASTTPGRFLPPSPNVEEPFRVTPKLALRVAILGMLALGIFGILFLRLWALQVLSGSQYLRTAQNNQLRTVRVQAPRGPILDRYGRVLVTNKAGTEIQIWPADLPKQGRYRLLLKLARIVPFPIAQVAAEIDLRSGDPLTPVIVKQGVSEDQVAYLYEHQDAFPGVQIAQTYLRRYPYGSLAAQVLGYTGEISAGQLKTDAKLGYRPGDTIGQAGVESSYDTLLRGVAGQAKLRVDSLGRPRSDLTLTQPPRAGNVLRLTIDTKLQSAAERAIRYGIGVSGEWAADGGAIVAMDPRDGSILALASYPTYSPGVYVGRVGVKALDAAGLTGKTAAAKNYPSLNRAVAGGYPPGSVFKPVTALAAMQEHLVSPYSSLPCTGVYKSHGQVFHNWDPFANSQMTLPTALAASCDTYFYRLGEDFYSLPPERGHPLQSWASRFGFGQTTGVDVGPETAGLLPTPEWRQQTFTRKTDSCCWQIDRLWKPGDSIQLAIGQKDLLVTPLQMARFYALIANGGRLVTPHVLMDIEQGGSSSGPGRVLRSYTGVTQPSGVDPAALAVVREGLFEATHANIGTSSAIFGSFPVRIAGKTGTAEKVVHIGTFRGLKNQSWWCGYGSADGQTARGKPPLVVCALIENGGHGGTAAAPAALQVFEQYFGVKTTKLGVIKSD